MSLIPPSSRDGWSYSGDFHVEASGNNRHRRATIPELKAVFDGTDGQKDRPAHWYEAQLIHYGLPPSKTKGTAKMRLFDAVGKGNLTVPAHILKVETELKKEWNKREREARQTAKLLGPTATAAKKPTKRKADDSQGGASSGTNVNINLSLSIGPQGSVQVAPTGPVAKKAKTTPATKKPAPVTKKPAPTTKKPAPATKKPAPATKKPAPATKKPAPATKKAASTAKNGALATLNPTQTAPPKKQTARRGTARAGASMSASSRITPAASPASADKPVARQTARRSRPFDRASQGRTTAASPQASRFDATPSHWDSIGSPPPPYPGPPSYFDDNDGDDGYHPSGLPPLGLLNGRYQLRCTAPHAHADDEYDSGIIFTLDGDALWGSFEIGPLSGILRLDERPWSSSHQPLYFEWRGEDSQGGAHSETDDGSYIKFLGNGEVVGQIGFYNTMLEFDGYRVSGSDTRSEVSAFSMRREWDERFF
ncbi:hypothetical protein CHGG_08655 [Chaetomium globosum CBS 148.51]|uniref:Uncharacterized protein n=1 Tax=Chaetomium globosum (strain ATCC 6205 / CBS 148.51 / DSM 1962 / NBRC 6347 / NRRL 1970) TaxID=306901 RepID=Q2GTP9_CHAGB|nr:uncharacterized protein CHGG_08655 [Chaetomium globosum CBS 148.51]EAQ84641.1 hypothetical protein CHGG_08655 [Chaetomium globosum CBS 148.51]